MLAKQASSARVVFERCGDTSDEFEVRGRIPLDCRHYAMALLIQARDLSRLIRVRPAKGNPLEIYPYDTIDVATSKLRGRPQAIEVREDGSCALLTEDYPVAALDLVHVVSERADSGSGVEVNLQYGTITVKPSHDVDRVEQLLRKHDQPYVAKNLAYTRR